MLVNCGLCSKQAAGSTDVMYSLWLMPEHEKLTCDETTVAESTDPTRNRLYNTARKIISQNNHPDQQFEPHVTLVGGLYNSSVQSLRGLCNRLVSELPGPCMKLDVCDAGHYHHTQCVYFKMVKGDGLRTLYERAQTLLSERAGVSLGVHGDVETYMPHMSLRYDCKAREDALKLCAGIERELASCEEFRTSVLELWDTTGPIGGWTCVGSYPFIHDEGDVLVE
ncbi:hypothetical protein SARC_03245 [Sphaeroforma arctica JP610]|uniref:Uncharacterized protein n=1 Tax=Sphaeroforma arctica JP610 TaxID=667725 RepID=A0A0L0G6A5_9EUKA|nr:hypothetical protein SARC_03245 [Sphaeroforma arctica JP610]KNC84542.1 hypothetical protein SARC_03245 [Sphaeroforma arctica JP610]|eukprot:XP_014158444.1 hypothetical protein SARC_03245 [Sphaeroforma arctica JP610]